jgi:hypothetical protein
MVFISVVKSRADPHYFSLRSFYAELADHYYASHSEVLREDIEARSDEASDANRASSMFIAAIIRTSGNVNVRQVSVVMRNIINCSDLRRPVRSVPDAVRDGTVTGWDSSGRWRAKVLRNLPGA